MISPAQEVELGDVFWDIPTWIYYTAGYDLGCSIYVANPSDIVREYALISHTYKNQVLQSEGVLQVYGYTWFTVDPGDFIKLNGQLNLAESDVVLTIDLIDKETQSSADTISTILVTPTAAALPPGWNVPGVDNLMPMIMMIMLMMMMGKMMGSVTETEEEKKKRLEAKERKKREQIEY